MNEEREGREGSCSNCPFMQSLDGSRILELLIKVLDASTHVDVNMLRLQCIKFSFLSAVDVACVVCETLSPESSLLFCCSCGNHYHGLCLKPVISASPVTRAGWQCPDCKTCQVSCAEFNVCKLYSDFLQAHYLRFYLFCNVPGNFSFSSVCMDV